MDKGDVGGDEESNEVAVGRPDRRQQPPFFGFDFLVSRGRNGKGGSSRVAPIRGVWLFLLRLEGEKKEVRRKRETETKLTTSWLTGFLLCLKSRRRINFGRYFWRGIVIVRGII